MLQLVQRQQAEAEAERQQRAAGGIEFLHAGGARRGGQQPGQGEGGGRDGGAEAEHRAPAEAFDQQAEDRGAERAADAEHHGVEAEDPGAAGFREQAGGQRRAAAEDQAGADALRDPAGQQPRIGLRQRAGDEGQAAPGGAEQEDAAVAEHVADAAEAEQKACLRQHVTDHDPLDHRDRQVEAAHDVREIDVHGGVERHHQRAQADHQQAP